MNLRPHHILCIQKFTGHGYNADFTAHMQSVVSQLKVMPETLVSLVQGCDDLCRSCPNNISGRCTSIDKVDAMDNAVLSICCLDHETVSQFSLLAEKVRKLIFQTDEFNNICSCCQWFDLCTRTEVTYG